LAFGQKVDRKAQDLRFSCQRTQIQVRYGFSSFNPPNDLTLPSECVALSWAGLEDFISPRGRRGGGNVGIGFIDFQGLWEGRETALSFSSLSMNRHFHGLPRSA
jgi:hypothetical protein